MTAELIGRKRAIELKCKDCIYDPYAGKTWRKQVEECTSTLCPLYPYRAKETPKRRVNTGKSGVSV